MNYIIMNDSLTQNAMRVLYQFILLIKTTSNTQQRLDKKHIVPEDIARSHHSTSYQGHYYTNTILYSLI